MELINLRHPTGRNPCGLLSNGSGDEGGPLIPGEADHVDLRQSDSHRGGASARVAVNYPIEYYNLTWAKVFEDLSQVYWCA